MQPRPARSGSLLPGVEGLRFDAVTTAGMVTWPDEDRQRLRRELERLFRDAFPRMPSGEILDWVEDYFKIPATGFQRRAFLLWKGPCRLAATTLFEEGKLEHQGGLLKGIHIIGRAVAPEYHNSGAGRRIATKILAEFQPDILMTTCTQSASLYSWIAVACRSFPEDYEVFPRLENGIPITLPLQDREFALNAFRRLYLSVVNGDLDQVARSVAGLTVSMVRKGMYAERYDFSPWEKAGRNDALARALGTGPGDGILLVIPRKGRMRS